MALAGGNMFDSKPESKSMKDAVFPAVMEICRREQAATALKEAGTRPAPPPMSFRPDQNFALFTAGTAVLGPRPLERAHPSLRVYGCFGTREEAEEHSQIISGIDGACSLLTVPCGDWFLFPQTQEEMENPSLLDETREERLRQHRADVEEENMRFDANVAERKPGGGTSKRWDEWTQEQEEELEAEKIVYGRPRRLRAGGEVRGQTACAACVVPDESGRGYVLLKILACFETTAAADEWVQNVASKSILDFNIYVLPTCEWVYPNGLKEESDTRRYRIEELQKIMDAADRNVTNVQTYKEWMRANHDGDATKGMVDLTRSPAVDGGSHDEVEHDAKPDDDDAEGDGLDVRA